MLIEIAILIYVIHNYVGRKAQVYSNVCFLQSHLKYMCMFVVSFINHFTSTNYCGFISPTSKTGKIRSGLGISPFHATWHITELYKYRTIQIPSYTNIELYKYRAIQIPIYTNNELNKYLTIKIPNYTNNELHKYLTTKIPNYTNNELNKYRTI